MNASKTISIIQCIAVAAVSLISSTAASAAEGGFTVKTMAYSPVQCTAKNPSQQKLLQPNARGLFNLSAKAPVPVLCMIPKPMLSRGCIAGEVNFYTVIFHINPSVSRGRAGLVHAFNTNIGWGELDPEGNNPKAGSEALADGTPGPGAIIVARKGSTGNPLDTWNGTDKYMPLAANLRMPCDNHVPTIRITIPPRAFATVIRDMEVRAAD